MQTNYAPSLGAFVPVCELGRLPVHEASGWAISYITTWLADVRFIPTEPVRAEKKHATRWIGLKLTQRVGALFASSNRLCEGNYVHWTVDALSARWAIRENWLNTTILWCVPDRRISFMSFSTYAYFGKSLDKDVPRVEFSWSSILILRRVLLLLNSAYFIEEHRLRHIGARRRRGAKAHDALWQYKCCMVVCTGLWERPNKLHILLTNRWMIQNL